MKRIAAFALFLSLAGCGGSYYKVSDPSTGKVYFTQKVVEKGGSIVFRDAATGNDISIQNSEIEKVNKEVFEAGKAARAK